MTTGQQAQVHIAQGDCLELMKGIPDGSVDLVCADPPYQTTQCKWDSIIPFAPMWAELKRVTKPNAAIVLFSAQPFSSALVMSNPEMFRYEWIWRKSRATGHLDVKRRPLREHEQILVFGDGQLTYNPQMKAGEMHSRGGARTGPAQVYGKFDDRKTTHHTEYFPKSILEFPCVLIPEHPTQKPFSLIEHLVSTYSNPGETVLDFCFGSGTCAVACINTNRNFIGFEMNEEYFCIATQRIKAAQGLTGLFAADTSPTPPPEPGTQTPHQPQQAQEALEF